MQTEKITEFLICATGTDKAPSLAALEQIDPYFFERHLDDAGVADILGCSAAAVQVRRSRGAGPPYLKIGASVRYRVRDVLDWAAAQRVDPKTRRKVAS